MKTFLTRFYLTASVYQIQTPQYALMVKNFLQILLEKVGNFQKLENSFLWLRQRKPSRPCFFCCLFVFVVVVCRHRQNQSHKSHGTFPNLSFICKTLSSLSTFFQILSLASYDFCVLQLQIHVKPNNELWNFYFKFFFLFSSFFPLTQHRYTYLHSVQVHAIENALSMCAKTWVIKQLV